MKEKVYCLNCVYLIEASFKHRNGSGCKHSDNVKMKRTKGNWYEPTFTTLLTEYKKPFVLNKRNNCKWFNGGI